MATSGKRDYDDEVEDIGISEPTLEEYFKRQSRSKKYLAQVAENIREKDFEDSDSLKREKAAEEYRRLASKAQYSPASGPHWNSWNNKTSLAILIIFGVPLMLVTNHYYRELQKLKYEMGCLVYYQGELVELDLPRCRSENP